LGLLSGGLCITARLGYRGIDAKLQRVTDYLQRAPFVRSAPMNGKDPRFVLARSKGRSLKNEAVPVVFSPLRLMHIGTESIRSAVFHELIINEELHFDSRAGRSFVNYPA
jgi:hypothetical protein